MYPNTSFFLIHFSLSEICVFFDMFNSICFWEVHFSIFVPNEFLLQRTVFAVLLEPVYTEYQRQYCDVASDIAVIKLLKFVTNQTSYPEDGLQPRLITYDASIDTEAPNQSLILSVNRP